MSCSHRRMVEKVDVYVDLDGNEIPTREWISVSTEEDIDLHRYKCTQCGKIGYYSGAARSFYEKGTKAPGITGLE